MPSWLKRIESAWNADNPAPRIPALAGKLVIEGGLSILVAIGFGLAALLVVPYVPDSRIPPNLPPSAIPVSLALTVLAIAFNQLFCRIIRAQ